MLRGTGCSAFLVTIQTNPFSYPRNNHHPTLYARLIDRIFSMFGANSKSKAPVAISDEAIGNLVEESKSMILEGKVDASIDHLLPIFKTRRMPMHWLELFF